MKFTVEIEDFYLEEENLNEGLKAYVRNEVIRKIHENIKEKVEKQITLKVNEEVQKTLVTVINSTINDFVTTEKIVSNGQEIEIREHLKNLFQKTSGWKTPQELILKLAKEFGAEMKSRYDLLFASQIVSKMQENGLLKDDVAKLLLAPKP